METREKLDLQTRQILLRLERWLRMGASGTMTLGIKDGRLETLAFEEAEPKKV